MIILKKWKSEGDGSFNLLDFKSIGENVVFEAGVRVFHPENIVIGDNVYIGHDTILKGYYKDQIVINSNVWIGQKCFIHGAGGVEIQENVGIGPGVYIHAAFHKEDSNVPISFSELGFSKIVIEKGANIGIGAILLPGVTIGENCRIGAGAVVTNSIPKGRIAVGVPAKVKD